MNPTKVLKLPTPRSRDNIDTYFVTGDWHSFYINENCFQALLAQARDIPKKNRFLIINGDFLDAKDFMTKKLKAVKKENIIASIEDYYAIAAREEFDWGNYILDLLAQVFPEGHIIFGEGNHDWRYSDFIKYYAPRAYKSDFDLKSQLKLSERKIRHYKYNDWLDIGNVSITHGMYHGQSAALKHYNACGRSVIFSHIHQVQARPFVRRGDTVMSWSTPCMCDLSPEYLKNTENNWANGYGILNMRSNGKFNYNTMMMFDGIIVSPNGKVYGRK